ncbi:MAG: beta-lactamase family protein [Clostridia bacterium]|nr:beta-lactamase family protein [Clostridia bacterium]
MTLHDRITDILATAVENGECAGINVLVRRYGEEVLYTQAGMADIDSHRPVQRDSIFRLYSQSKPVTAAAVMLLVERGLIDLMDGVDKYLPGFRHAKVVDGKGNVTKAYRAPWIMELLGMTAGLSYPGEDPAGQYAARVFEDAHAQIRAGGGIPTVEFMNRLGEQPLAFQPGTHWRYSTCADVLGAVIEVVSGKRFGSFLKEELFEPLDMVDTAFWVPEEKWERFVTCYKRTPEGLTPWLDMNLACGEYSRDPAFESGGAGLTSTLEDYSHFADMMLGGGVYNGKRILSPASVKFLTTPQLDEHVRRDMWDSLNGYSYGKLSRVCVEPERVAGLAMKGEYGWDGWLGTYFCNFPEQGMTLLSMQNTTDCGTAAAVRKVRNAVLAALSEGTI